MKKYLLTALGVTLVALPILVVLILPTMYEYDFSSERLSYGIGNVRISHYPLQKSGTSEIVDYEFDEFSVSLPESWTANLYHDPLGRTFYRRTETVNITLYHTTYGRWGSVVFRISELHGDKNRVPESLYEWSDCRENCGYGQDSWWRESYYLETSDGYLVLNFSLADEFPGKKIREEISEIVESFEVK